MQTSRLFEIIYLLLSKKSVTAKELAARFGVSTRTIYRDIDTLSLSGIPVYTEKGKGGGISLLPDFVLNKSILSEQDQNEILSALQGLSNVMPAETAGTLQKMSAIFNKNVSSWLEVDFSDWSYINGNLWSDFKTAILDKRIAEFDYYSTYGEKTSRRIEPIQLWFKSKAWYIKGFCLEKQDIRLFKLTRVKNLAITDEGFGVRDLSATRPSVQYYPPKEQKSAAFVLKIAAEMAYRVLDEFDEDLVDRQEDGSFVVMVTWPEDTWVYGNILSYGRYIEVLEPAYIREAMKEKLKEILTIYL